MRITQNMMTDRVMTNLWRNMSEMDKLNNEISSGKKFTNSSDDPSGVLSSMRLTSAINANQQFSANIDQGVGLLQTTDGALQQLGDVLNRVKELAVQGASGTLDDTARQGIAAEVYQLKEQVKNIANTDDGGKFVFAGTDFHKQPWDNTAQTWVGNGNDVKYQIGEGTSLSVNVPGDTIFTPLLSPSGSSVLDKLIQDLGYDPNNPTQSNSPPNPPAPNILNISTQDIANIQDNIDNVLTSRAEVGARVNRLQMTKDRLTSQATNLQGLLSNAQDIDMAQVITQLKSQQDTYNASLASAAQILQPSLIDFLK